MKKILFLLFILISPILTYAADPLELEIIPIEHRTMPTGTATYQIRLINNQNKQDTFTVYPDELAIAPFSDSFESAYVNESSITLKSFSNKLLELKVTTTKNVIPNRNYALTLYAKSLTNSNTRTKTQINVRTIKPDKTILITPLTEEILPADTIELKFTLQNILNQDFEQAEIYITSDFLEFTKTIRIIPHQERTDTFTMPMDQTTKEGTYEVTIRIYEKQTLIGEESFDVNILSSQDVTEKVEHSNFLLTRITKITKTNRGNTESEEIYQFKLPKVKRIITSYTPEPASKGNNLIWYFNLQPGESKTIIIEERYNAVALVLIIIILLICIIRYWTKKDVEVTKKVFRLKGEKGIGEMKILLTIKNKSNKIFRNVKVIEVIPQMIKPLADFGTLKPSKKFVGENIRSLMWTLPVLDKGEERILTYKIKPTLNIVGKVILPATLVKYVDNKKDYNVRSNSLSLFSEK